MCAHSRTRACACIKQRAMNIPDTVPQPTSEPRKPMTSLVDAGCDGLQDVLQHRLALALSLAGVIARLGTAQQPRVVDAHSSQVGVNVPALSQHHGAHLGTERHSKAVFLFSMSNPRSWHQSSVVPLTRKTSACVCRSVLSAHLLVLEHALKHLELHARALEELASHLQEVMHLPAILLQACMSADLTHGDRLGQILVGLASQADQ